MERRAGEQLVGERRLADIRRPHNRHPRRMKEPVKRTIREDLLNLPWRARLLPSRVRVREMRLGRSLALQ